MEEYKYYIIIEKTEPSYLSNEELFIYLDGNSVVDFKESPNEEISMTMRIDYDDEFVYEVLKDYGYRINSAFFIDDIEKKLQHCLRITIKKTDSEGRVTNQLQIISDKIKFEKNTIKIKPFQVYMLFNNIYFEQNEEKIQSYIDRRVSFLREEKLKSVLE